MGMFARVMVNNSVELPYFPVEIDRDELRWQSKQGLDVYGGPYRIIADGRLEQKKQSYREKTEVEKQAEAEKWGFDSWEEYCHAYDENDDVLIPDEVGWSENEHGYDDYPPTLYPEEQVLDEEWWGDYNMHGTFEFHQYFRRDPTEWETIGDVEKPANHALEVFMEYEARFTKGELDEIVFMGERGFNDNDGDPVEEALNAIQEWREWRAENPDKW